MTYIHNGIKHQWNYLERVDRASGEKTVIRLDDEESAVDVQRAARTAGLRTSEAWELLLSGGHLTTFGFVRRLTK